MGNVTRFTLVRIICVVCVNRAGKQLALYSEAGEHSSVCVWYMVYCGEYLGATEKCVCGIWYIAGSI